jgi:predicted O-linked N-acetylglucosamine transferase (SPINDLY family)
MTSKALAIANDALSLLRSNRIEDALATLNAIDNDEHTEASLRVRATALAMRGSLPAAEDDIRRARSIATNEARAPEVATLAIAARIAEDAGDEALAFDRYAQLVGAQPAQHTFWRGLWRAAIASKDTALRTRALSLALQSKIDIASDPNLCAAVARVWCEQLRSRDDLAALLQTLKRACSAHPRDTALASLRMSLVLDAGPAFGSEEQSAVAMSLSEALPHTSASEAADTMRGIANMLLKIPEIYTDEAAISQWRERYANGLQALVELANEKRLTPDAIRHTAFRLAYHGRNDRELQAKRGELLPTLVAAHTPSRAPARVTAKLRVGFVSKHLRDCTVGHYFRRFVTDLASDELDVLTYGCGKFDALTDAIEQRATTARRFPLANDEDNEISTLVKIATAIASDALDVLVYPEVGMEPLIEKLAAMRLAPLQCALWGHPDTTGLPTIDVFFSVERMEPANAQAHYGERLHLLPGLGCAYPRPPTPAALDRAALDLPTNVALLVCAQSSFKWRPKFVAAVAQILRENPNSKLVYFRSRDAVAAIGFDAYLEAMLRSANLDIRERCIELPETTRERFLAILAACDLALDTFDFSGGNTTLDSLSVGLPVVTLPGEFMRGRQSMAMLQLIDANELIAQSDADYVRIANELLGDPSGRKNLSERLRTNAEKLFDDPIAITALRDWLLQRRES